jgi:adenylate cyclase
MKSWLLSEGRTHTSPVTFMNAMCEQLESQGVEFSRVSIMVRTVHPTYEFLVLIRTPASMNGMMVSTTEKIYSRELHDFDQHHIEQFLVEYGHTDEATFASSPFQAIIDGKSMVRCRLQDINGDGEYPIFKDLLAAGMTDYMAIPVDLLPPDYGMMSFCSACPGGFEDEQVALLQEIQPLVSMLLSPLLMRDASQSILAAYLGAGPAQEVYAGRIQLGNVEELEAVIGFVDMRSFTATTRVAEGTQVIQRLNEFFSALNMVVTDAGGLILKFMGDGALVVFPLGEDKTENVAKNALDAHKQFRQRVNTINSDNAQDPLGPIDFGMALHIGTVLYGNIGAPNRLDFTVIGPAVNLAARLEGLCPRFGVDIVVSEAFAQLLPDVFEDMGTQRVRGVGSDIRVFQQRP